ncbi:short chain dehydrogenase/reductase, YcfH family [Psychroflexus torquis ATCC 700755]|uniref:Short chain dehydrogenase/reductase, YcfH family n=1 Tax=Psychroflexus torquis (strain ATCC 700755 / CIP 106069 / ACAM 623) TaxID=313595 RepID=K4IJM1_PSYTT|nr:TIGR01777 family oxidoreductase [Psychroflexus torquis]AFU69311.1 short chain dehydrogenase/reductase, YcfH family [Psychroflexus torquis ATCC 700755]
MRVLITGATGLVGQALVKLFHEKGISVNYLTTSRSKIKTLPNYQGFYWDPSMSELDVESLKDVTTIINLAGASVAKKWTSSYKKEILNSRLDTLMTLKKALSIEDHQVEQLISASAIGLYKDSLTKFHEEEQFSPGNNFLADVVLQWEAAADEVGKLGIDVAKIRIGLVLAKDGGALEKIKQPIENYIGAPLGTGKQWQSWIHIDDLNRIFLYVMEHKLEGVFNAVAPSPVNNRELTECIAKRLGKPLILPKVPAFVLKLMLGEMATIVLGSQLVSSKKMLSTGFQFNYAQLKPALADLL